jgi:hypothetical protein
MELKLNNLWYDNPWLTYIEITWLLGQGLYVFSYFDI